MDIKDKPEHIPFIGKSKCMIKNCKKRSEVILYFLVGPNIDIKSMRGAMCKDHAESEKEYYSSQLNREVRIEDIDSINKKVKEKLGQ